VKIVSGTTALGLELRRRRWATRVGAKGVGKGVAAAFKARGGGRPWYDSPQEEARVRGRRGGRVRHGRVRLGADPRKGMTPGSHLSATQGGGRRRGLRRAVGGLPETGLRAS
jgi:hypothetical protein